MKRSTGETRLIHIDRRMLALAALGLTLVGTSAIFAWTPRRPVTPGKLVATEDRRTWQTSPAENKPLHPGDSTTTFELRNVGGQPVRILEILSGCGCAKPTVTPMTIPSGGTGIVDVQTTPMMTGEKEILITLRTDSPVTPELDLRLQVIGSVQPPYLLGTTGDLTFSVGDGDSEVRTIKVIMLEKEGSKPKLPIVKTDVPDFEIGRPILHQEHPYPGEGNLSRTYHVETKLAKYPDQGSLVGDVSVVDPWNPQHVQQLRVHVEVKPSWKASPSRVVFRLRGDASEDSDQVQVLIASRSPEPDLVAEVEGSAPLLADNIQQLGDPRRHVLTIRVKPGAHQPGEYVVRVGPRSSGQRLSIPVAILVGGRR